LTKLNAISRLIAGLKREHHDYKPSLHLFPELNPDKIASDLQLDREAKGRGRRNEPPADSTALDDFELRIVDRIESEKNTAHNTYVEEMRVYAERLAGLEFEERFNAIRNAAPQAVSEFKVEAAQGRDELNPLRKGMRDAAAELELFKRDHRLQRLSRHATGGTKTLKYGILVFLTLVEVALNGAFLSKASYDGYLGGMSEAFVFAVLNVLVSFAVAAVGVRWITHRNPFAKLVGVLSLAFYVCFAIALNLALAHYREIATALSEEAGREVIARIASDPLGFADLKSWLFLGLGLTFSAVAFGDAFLIYDPYWGFGARSERAHKEQLRYRTAKEALIANLKEILEEAVDTMEEAGRDLSRRRGAYDSYMQGRERVNQLFVGYQDHLERTANTLLSKYREANVKARTDGKHPERFRKRYEMVRIPLPADQGVALARDDLRKALTEAHDLLNSQVAAIHAVFKSEVDTYKQIDDLVPENDDVPQLKVA